MTKVILDTDIGTDIDDAVALAYLLAQPRCELLGITTVSGQALERARMCSALCRVAGVETPIYPGIERPMLIDPQQTTAAQAARLDRWDHQRDFPAGQAIPFLQKTIRDNPGEVVLLAIGPMTNLGVLFAMDPGLPSLLRSLVLMCGVFTRKLPGSPVSEWNALNDPHAAAITYSAGAAVHRSIGLDVTRQVTMRADEVRQRFGQVHQLAPVLDFAEVWFEAGREVITFHDPLAAATVFEPSLCEFQRGRVEVELGSAHFAGATLFMADPSGRHEVAIAVDAEGFFEHYFATVAGAK